MMVWYKVEYNRMNGNDLIVDNCTKGRLRLHKVNWTMKTINSEN